MRHDDAAFLGFGLRLEDHEGRISGAEPPLIQIEAESSQRVGGDLRPVQVEEHCTKAVFSDSAGFRLPGGYPVRPTVEWRETAEDHAEAHIATMTTALVDDLATYVRH